MKDIFFDLEHNSKCRMDTTAAKLFAEDESYLGQAEADAAALSARARKIERRCALRAWLQRVFNRKP